MAKEGIDILQYVDSAVRTGSSSSQAGSVHEELIAGVQKVGFTICGAEHVSETDAQKGGTTILFRQTDSADVKLVSEK